MHFIRIQTADFDTGVEINTLRLQRPDTGALVAFVGQVREFHSTQVAQPSLVSLTLEHYPGMTEKSLKAIAEQASRHWSVHDILIVHRVGELTPLEQIVLVAVTSRHRGEAFQACEFVMDYLKTQAPFWKKEATSQGAYWVDARESDDQALQKWQISSGT